MSIASTKKTSASISDPAKDEDANLSKAVVVKKNLYRRVSDKIKLEMDRSSKPTLIILIVLIGLLSYLVNQRLNNESGTIKERAFSQLIKDSEEKKVKSIRMDSGFLVEEARVELKDGTKYRVASPRIDSGTAAAFVKGGVADLQFNLPETDYSHLVSNIIMLLIAGSLAMTMLPSLSGLRLGRSRTKSTTKFADVAGAEEAKRALEDVVAYLEDSGRFEKLGARFTKGVIMYGEPGTGKTLLAKAVAGEAGANFIAVSGSDFGSMFVGMSAMKVRQVFAKARKTAPCVLFIDEIDAIGGKRLSEGSAVAREMGSTLNQMLVEMDGFDSVPGVIIIAATNRLELLDPALLRSGRFDRRIHMPAPNLAEREAILRIHGGKIKISDDFNFSDLARATIGMSGADLSNVMNQAAIQAAKLSAESVSTKQAMQARDIVLMGEARPSMSSGFDDYTRRLLAAHEAGHAVVGMIKGPDPVTRVSMIPRGPALGVTFISPVKERYVHDNTYISAQIKVLLGGRAAENLVMKISTTGAQDDLNRATQLAHSMVCSHGMTRNGLQVVGERSSDLLKSHAEEMVEEILREAMLDAKQTLHDHKGLFLDLINALLEFEEIDEDAITKLQIKHNVLTRINKDPDLADFLHVTDDFFHEVSPSVGLVT